MQYQWAEDDFDLPYGVTRLGLSAPIDGRKYVMYHGTTRQNAQSIKKTGFQQSAGGMLGRGVYLSRDLQKASRYPIDHPESDRAVIKVLVSVGRVITINHQKHPQRTTWHDHGYDTAWVPPNCGMTKSGLEEDCVWDPKRIKITKIINPLPVPVQRSNPPLDMEHMAATENLSRNNEVYVSSGEDLHTEVEQLRVLIKKRDREIEYNHQLVEKLHTERTDMRQSICDLKHQLETRQEEEVLAGVGNFRQQRTQMAENTEKPAAEPRAAEVQTRSLWRRCAKGLLDVGLAVGLSTAGTLASVGIMAPSLADTFNMFMDPHHPYCSLEPGAPCPT